jgi:hypothetical protein
MLNDLIDFSQNLTLDELEEEIRQLQGEDFLEGRAVHFFSELNTILEYVPAGYKLDEDDDEKPATEDEELEKNLADVETDHDEKIEEDETMKWDEEEEEEEYEETTKPPDEQAES